MLMKDAVEDLFVVADGHFYGTIQDWDDDDVWIVSVNGDLRPWPWAKVARWTA